MRTPPVGLLIPSALLLSSVARAGVLPPESRLETLDNGLTVVVLPLDTPGLVSVQTWMDVGSRHEVEAGTTGYAHFFEHLMFHGTPTMSGDAREARLLELAAEENAWTSDDATCYHLLLPARAVDEVLGIEGDRFQNLVLDDEGVRREAGAVQGEWRKGQSDPSWAPYMELWDTAFDTHTYAHTPIGTDEDVLGMPDGLDKALAFFAAHYRPENATVVVAGDVEPEAVIARVRETHGGWSVQGEARVEPTPEPPQTELRRVVSTWTKGSTNPKLALGWRIPARDVDSVEVAAVDVLAELLTSQVSPLRRRLVDEEGLVWGAWSSGVERTDPGLLELHYELKEGVDPAVVEAIVMEEVAALVAAPDLEARVSQTGQRLERQLLLNLSTGSSWASTVGDVVQLTGSLDGLDRAAATLGKVSAEDVRAAAVRYLVPQRLTVVVLLPAEAPPPEDPPAEDSGGDGQDGAAPAPQEVR